MSTATTTTTSDPTPRNNVVKSTLAPENNDSRTVAALKHLFCGGVAGSAAKTVTAPLSRLTILFQVHSMVTTKENRPKFAMTSVGGLRKIVERGGYLSMWKGNLTSVIHRFPYSGINFYCYENVLHILSSNGKSGKEDEDSSVPPLFRFLAGAMSGTMACVACYPLDLVRTRLTTDLAGHENYKGISDAFSKILKAEGVVGLYSGLLPTLCVAVPNLAISYTVYGTLKEYVLDDELFYNMRRIDDDGEASLAIGATLLLGAASGFSATIVTFPFDTIRRRMQIQNLHLEPADRLTALQQLRNLAENEGKAGIYRGIRPELAKVIPMVGTMFLVYEFLKEKLDVNVGR